MNAAARKPGLARNTASVVAARLADIAGSAVLLVVAARYFGLAEFGVYAYIQGIALFLTPVLDWGVQRILIRDLAVDRHGAGGALAAGVAINLLVSLAVAVLLAGVQAAAHLVAPDQVAALALAVGSQSVLCLTRCLSSVFIAFERMAYETLMSLVSRSLVVAGCLGVVLAGGGVTAFFGAIFAASAGGLVLAAWLAATRFVRPGPWPGFGRVRALFREANALAVSSFLNQGYSDIYVFPLKFLRGPLDVSYFQAGKRMLDAAIVVTRALIIAMAPGISRLGDTEEGARRLGGQLVTASRLALVLMAPAAAGVTLLADDLATLLFGRDFAPVGPSLGILAWTLPFFFVNALMETALTALHRPRALVATHGTGFAFAVLAGILAIRNGGAVGAAWTMLAAYALVCLLNTALVARLIGLPGMIPALAGPAAACLVVFGGARLVLGGTHPVLAAAAGLALYLPALLAARVVSREELAGLAGLARRRGPGKPDARPPVTT